MEFRQRWFDHVKERCWIYQRQDAKDVAPERRKKGRPKRRFMDMVWAAWQREVQMPWWVRIRWSTVGTPTKTAEEGRLNQLKNVRIKDKTRKKNHMLQNIKALLYYIITSLVPFRAFAPSHKWMMPVLKLTSIRHPLDLRWLEFTSTSTRCPSFSSSPRTINNFHSLCGRSSSCRPLCIISPPLNRLRKAGGSDPMETLTCGPRSSSNSTVIKADTPLSETELSEPCQKKYATRDLPVTLCLDGSPYG